MANQALQLEALFQALANPTRRVVVERLAHGPATVSELARYFDMALPSFTQHLQVLERSGLVRSRKEGRVRTYWLEPKPLQAAEEWLDAAFRSIPSWTLCSNAS